MLLSKKMVKIRHVKTNILEQMYINYILSSIMRKMFVLFNLTFQSRIECRLNLMIGCFD